MNLPGIEKQKWLKLTLVGCEILAGAPKSWLVAQKFYRVANYRLKL